MSKTDIYNTREPIKSSSVSASKKRRRRSESSKTFGVEQPRKRRSRNSGLRRLLHLSRKSENDKKIWITIFVLIAVALTWIGIWQFWYLDYQIQKQSIEQAQKEASMPAVQVGSEGE